MTSRIESVYQWVSPISFAGMVAMVYLGLCSAEPVLQGWSGAIFWATTGALGATAIISAVLGLLAAQQNLRVAQARVQRHRQDSSAGQRPVCRGELHS
jgi:O-antigen ligase